MPNNLTLIRVYYEDTDSGGVVYYANYLKFAERARTEALRALGIEQRELLETHDIAFVVRKCALEFFKPAQLDDLLTITTHITDISKVTLCMQQTIFRADEKLVTCEVKLAVINSKKTLAKLPEFVHKALTQLFT
jgi:acyl-CoA thioester hydrolase